MLCCYLLILAETVIPNETSFQDVDWIIGNHADELAPWIPIIASRSKPLTRFVVIPCCFFGLSGSRYQFPKGFPEGKYKAYQEYISDIINLCDYELQTEILRIPSTKNVALVGSGRKLKRKRDEQGSSSLSESSAGDATPVGSEPAEEVEQDDEDGREERRKQQIVELIESSGEFVARKSDKDKQELQKIKQAAKLSARGVDPESTSVMLACDAKSPLAPEESSHKLP